ncbi:hypothetical protein D3C71_343950 [compost metagenome]
MIMKSIHLSKLNNLALQEQRIKFPSVPDHCRAMPSYKDNSANYLTKSVIKFIQLTGGQAERISVQGQFKDNRKIVIDSMGFKKTIGSTQFIKSSMTKGSADISASITPLGGTYAASVKIEIKQKDKQSEFQKLYEQSIDLAGGVYIIVRSFDEFYEWWSEFTGKAI